MAYLGGVVLITLTIATCVSIIGRALVPLDLGVGPIKGIYDMTEIGVAAAVFAFMPWCQFNRGHASVDLFTPLYPKLMNRFIDLMVDLGMLLIAAVGAWRLYLGMLDKMRYGETTLILQFPVWQAFLASLIGACAFAIIAAFCVLRSLKALFGGSGEEAAQS
ncbi:MAG: TRAP transporter small permease [Rhodobacteraceae bacterium]|nr:TRAP transporter small permease [Paracoccaceae bacterium]